MYENTHKFAFMKKRASFRAPAMAAILFLLSGLSGALAQTIPAEVVNLFNKADAEISGFYSHSGPIARDVRANDFFRPRIAVPDCEEAGRLKDMVRISGGEPVDMPSEGCSVMDLRLSAVDWDGAAMPDGWVRAENEYSILVFKTVATWNMPFVGESELSRLLDNGLRRLPFGITSFEELTRKARTYRRAVELMDGIFTIDTHSDLPDDYEKGRSVGTRTLSQSGVPRMDEGRLDSQILISFLWQGPTDDTSSRLAVERNLARIAEIKKDVAKYPHLCGIATTPAEARALNAEGKKAFLVALENGYGIGNDLGNIKRMRDLGVVYITLCHFSDNAICNTSSNRGGDPTKGLTEYGKQVVKEMNRQGIMIDLSHPSAQTFWDCVNLSEAPVICSHSGAKAIYGHDRGLDDRQLKALAGNGGVIQVYTVPDFLCRSSATIDDFMSHFNHCVEVAGPEHVGIGSDFDGGGGVIGCNGVNDLVNVTVKMLEHGYTPDQIKGFWGGNFLRVMEEVQSKACRD